MPERKGYPFLKEIAGMRPDDGSTIDIPAWLLLQNVWVSPNGKLRSRPFFSNYSRTHSNLINGIDNTHSNGHVYVADGNFYIDGYLRGTISGSGFLKVDVSRKTTVFTVGGYPVIWNGTGSIPLTNLPNIYTLATFAGAQRLRLAAVSSNDTRKIIITAPGNLNDTGTTITDPLGINDEKTEGHIIKNMPYEITDMAEMDGSIYIFTKHGIFKMDPTVKEFGFSVQIGKVVNMEVWPGKVYRAAGQYYFLNSDGIFAFSGQGIKKINMDGMERTIRSSMVYGQTHISYDNERKLLFLTPNDTDSTTWVYNERTSHWYRWDLAIRDTVCQNGTVYIAAKYQWGELKDTFTHPASTDIVLKSGLNTFGNELSRKVFKRILLNIQASSEIQYFMDIFTDSIPDTPLQPLISDKPPYQVLSADIMKKAKRGSVYIRIKTFKELVFDDLSIVYYEKPARVGIRSL